jgi:aerobic carbon-monoxide dehydrogenase small subunit
MTGARAVQSSRPIRFTVNGGAVLTQVEARTHLADYLRDHLGLTGTHVGCEHGVCGACTVLVDGVPVRSCITYVATCDGVDVRTIEGFGDDARMAQLREAFCREHALQCGFCTAGMLVTALDIVQRLPSADERKVRVELSGNLCRCTGYAGIVAAVQSVLCADRSTDAQRRNSHETSEPVSCRNGADFPADEMRRFEPVERLPAGSARKDERAIAGSTPDTATLKPEREGGSRFEETFIVSQAPGLVWETFGDVVFVASCLPGAEILEHDATSVKGRMTARMGPIAASFSGAATIQRDEDHKVGRIIGAGNDKRSGTRTRGEVGYRLEPADDGATRVLVCVDYSLQGPLAQFSRSSLVQELGRSLIAEFARNLNARLAGGGGQLGASAVQSLSVLWLVRSLVVLMKNRLGRLFRIR